MRDITKIKQDFDKKVAKIKALIKNPQQDARLLGNCNSNYKQFSGYLAFKKN